MGNKQSVESISETFNKTVNRSIREQIVKNNTKNKFITNSKQTLRIKGLKCSGKVVIKGIQQFSALKVNFTSMSESINKSTFESMTGSAIEAGLKSTKDIEQGLSIASQMEGKDKQALKNEVVNEIKDSFTYEDFQETTASMSATQELDIGDIEGDYCEISDIRQTILLDIFVSKISSTLTEAFTAMASELESAVEMETQTTAKQKGIGEILAMMNPLALLANLAGSFGGGGGFILLILGLILVGVGGFLVKNGKGQMRIGGIIAVLVGLLFIYSFFSSLLGASRRLGLPRLGASPRKVLMSIQKSENYNQFAKQFPNVSVKTFILLKDEHRKGLLSEERAAAILKHRGNIFHVNSAS